MKTIHWLIIMLTLLVTNCQEEQLLPDKDNIELPNKSVLFTICTDAPPMEKPITRIGMANENNMMGGLFWIFVFDNTGTPTDSSNIKLLEIAKAEPTTASTPGAYKWNSTLKVRNHPVKVLMIANTPTQVYTANGMNPTTINTIAFPVNMTYNNVLAKLYTEKFDATLNTVPYTPNHNIPMSKVMDFTELTAQTNLGTETNPLEMPRAVAKITVDNTTPYSNTDFVLLSANLHNVPSSSSLIARTTVLDATSRTKYEGSSVGLETSDISTANPPIIPIAGVKQSTASNPLYCYESNATDIKNIFLIVQGTYKGENTYYKLKISTATNGNTIRQIQRNMHYRIVIKQCNTIGYNSYTEALTAPPSNLFFDVEVTDLSSHDITDNGMYYIALSNTEYHFYAFNGIANLPVATLYSGTNTNAPTFHGTVHITSSTPSLMVQTNNISHPVNHATILATVTNEFVEGMLTVHLGNLVKEIKIVRKNNSFIEIKNELIVNKDYKNSKYKVAQVSTPKQWIKVGTSPDVTLATGQDKVATDGGGVYIAYNTQLAPPDLEHFVYISRIDSGRIKVHFLLAPPTF